MGVDGEREGGLTSVGHAPAFFVIPVFFLSYPRMRVSMVFEGGRDGPPIKSGVTGAGGGGDKCRSRG